MEERFNLSPEFWSDNSIKDAVQFSFKRREIWTLIWLPHQPAPNPEGFGPTIATSSEAF